jgi:hypothetical protein
LRLPCEITIQDKRKLHTNLLDVLRVKEFHDNL